MDNTYVATAFTLPRAAQWKDLTYNGSILCAISDNAGTCAVATDGLGWAEYGMPATLNGGYVGIASKGTDIVAVARANGFTAISHNNGQTWSGSEKYYGFLGSGIASNQSNYVYVTGITHNWSLVSADGDNWGASNAPYSATYPNIEWCNNNYIMYQPATLSYKRSANGLDWPSVVSYNLIQVNAMAGNGTLICAVGNNACTLSYDNGATWIDASNNIPTGNWQGIIHNGDVFCAVGGTNMCAITKDGLLWKLINVPYSGGAVAAFGTTIAVLPIYQSGVYKNTGYILTARQPITIESTAPSVGTFRRRKQYISPSDII